MLIEVRTGITQEEADFIKSAENLAHNTRFGIERAWWQSGKDIQAEFKKETIAKNKTGRLYVLRTSKGTKRNHRASGPGQTPASRPPSVGGGQYRKGIDFNVRTERELVVGNSAEHAPWLEEGTLYMRARPGLRNSINASERDIIRNIYEEISEAL